MQQGVTALVRVTITALLRVQFDCCGIGNSSDIEGFWSAVPGVSMVPPSCCSTFAANSSLVCVPGNQFNVVSGLTPVVACGAGVQGVGCVAGTSCAGLGTSCSELCGVGLVRLTNESYFEGSKLA